MKIPTKLAAIILGFGLCACSGGGSDFSGVIGGAIDQPAAAPVEKLTGPSSPQNAAGPTQTEGILGADYDPNPKNTIANPGEEKAEAAPEPAYNINPGQPPADIYEHLGDSQDTQQYHQGPPPAPKK